MERSYFRIPVAHPIRVVVGLSVGFCRLGLTAARRSTQNKGTLRQHLS